METGISDFLMFAGLAILAGVIIVFKLHREIKSRINQKALLMLAMSSGIIAFSFKVLAVVTISSLPPEIEMSQHNLDRKNKFTPYPASMTFEEFVPTAYQWEALPDQAEAPADNPLTQSKITLGKTLFFDKRLSANNSVSCATCHPVDLNNAGTDGLSLAKGIDGKLGTRNTPTVLNAAFQSKLFWDARASSLEEQALGPIFNPVEMGVKHADKLLEKLANSNLYEPLFIEAFGDAEINLDRIAKAIASYERTLITPNSAYDRFVKGDSNALNAAQKRGMKVFEKAGCVLCHAGPNFSGASHLAQSSYETFIFPAIETTDDVKKFKLLTDKGAAAHEPTASRGIWRVPSLRNVSLTAPYFHNGSVETLEDAVRIMAETQLNTQRGENSVLATPANKSSASQAFLASNTTHLSDRDIDDIVSFLESLEGEYNNLIYQP